MGVHFAKAATATVSSPRDRQPSNYARQASLAIQRLETQSTPLRNFTQGYARTQCFVCCDTKGTRTRHARGMPVPTLALFFRPFRRVHQSLVTGPATT